MEQESLLIEVINKAKNWLSAEYDEETRKEVQRMLDAEDKTELIEAFYKDLEFGTGGLRGIMGVGSNKMNIYTVGAATQGLSNYLKKEFAKLDEIKVVIGYDCRNNSRKFAEISADIFSANGIRAYLFDDLRPTPEVSFAIRELKAQSGIILTASHNPKEYNGYKCYWEDGAQVVSPHDKNIISEVNSVRTAADIKFKGNKKLITIIGEEIDTIYLDKITTISLSPDSIAAQNDLKIVYTPIHGTGVRLIPAILQKIGFKNVIHVEEQDVVSGDFPTVVSPNPEEPAALELAVKKAIATDADLVLASDPDADRMGVAVKNSAGEFVLLNGNQIASIFIYYILRRNSELGRLTGKEYIVKTIVTTELIKNIADKQGVECFDCYTGFKWIAAVIRENEGIKQYIGGGEESYGFLAQDFVRDKDAVSACALMAEVTAWAKGNGQTLFDLLLDIYVEYGYSMECGISVVKKGKSGAEEIARMMDGFFANAPKEIAGSRVSVIKNYKTLYDTDVESGEKSIMDMPTTSDVIQYFTEDGTKVSVRPSGTEPKIKFYIELKDKLSSREEYDNVVAASKSRIQAVKDSLNI
ncbi:MAG: phospho-sugar mutase [Bacteroidales bacterium]|jgi:phosphoglucomutase|nr:phospho-sugar mutase [Bacteroidales bacterium]